MYCGRLKAFENRCAEVDMFRILLGKQGQPNPDAQVIFTSVCCK
jgi:hypothetical protein